RAGSGRRERRVSHHPHAFAPVGFGIGGGVAMWVYKGGWRVQLAWPEFLTDLEQREGSEASVDLECRGAFVRFRSRLVQVDRPKACNADAARRFGVVPQQVGLLFANGVRIIIHMRHV